MNFKQNLVGAIAVIALVIAVIGVFTPRQSSVVGAVANTNFTGLGTTQLQVGTGCDNSFGTCNGTAIAQVLKGTCNLIGSDSSQAATTTVAYDCAVTNAQSGDTVFAQLASTTPALGGSMGWVIVATKASSTSGYITVMLTNMSGASRVPSVTSVGSSTQYLIIR
jgi:hypothetical protein